MLTENLQKLDAHLSESDYDSQAWSDGMGCEQAQNLLRKFNAEEWRQLSEMWTQQDIQWRCCLISALCPGLGGDGQEIITSSLDDADPRVAFEALQKVTFYCGVNSNPEGPFVDRSIQNNEFKTSVSRVDGIIEKITGISNDCGPHFQAEHNLLIKQLSQET